MDYAKEFTAGEIMAVSGSRELRDGEVSLIGVGLPQISGIIAKYTHAPHLKILLEIGVIDPKPIHMAVGLSDPRIWYGCSSMTGWLDVMGMALHRGKVDVGFLSGIQIDEYGNLNSTQVGPIEKPVRHFTGSGGANDIASLAKRIIIIMKHEKRRFQKKVDYITSPGFIGGTKERFNIGLHTDGPVKVITDMAILGFDGKSSKMKLLSVHPMFSIEEVKNNFGFEIIIPKDVSFTLPPTIEEQKIIRTIADISGAYTGWK